MPSEDDRCTSGCGGIRSCSNSVHVPKMASKLARKSVNRKHECWSMHSIIPKQTMAIFEGWSLYNWYSYRYSDSPGFAWIGFFKRGEVQVESIKLSSQSSLRISSFRWDDLLSRSRHGCVHSFWLRTDRVLRITSWTSPLWLRTSPTQPRQQRKEA